MEEITGKKTVLLDTNFLLLPYQFGIDIFTQIKKIIQEPDIIIGSCVVDELEKLGKNKGKKGRAAHLALTLIAREKCKLVEGNRPVDRWIVSYAKRHRAIVCTNDRKVRQHIKRLKLRAIVLKGKGRIGLD